MFVCFLHVVILLSSKICSTVVNATVALYGNFFLRTYAPYCASNCKNLLAVWIIWDSSAAVMDSATDPAVDILSSLLSSSSGSGPTSSSTWIWCWFLIFSTIWASFNLSVVSTQSSAVVHALRGTCTFNIYCMLSQIFLLGSGSGSRAVGTLLMKLAWWKHFSISCGVIYSHAASIFSQAVTKSNPFITFSRSFSVSIICTIWCSGGCSTASYRPWLRGCSFEDVFGGRNWTLMLEYSLVMWEGALSMSRRMCHLCLTSLSFHWFSQCPNTTEVIHPLPLW